MVALKPVLHAGTGVAATRFRGMEQSEEKSRGSDVKAWVTIALIDAVATAAVCGLYIWLNGATS